MIHQNDDGNDEDDVHDHRHQIKVYCKDVFPQVPTYPPTQPAKKGEIREMKYQGEYLKSGGIFNVCELFFAH